MSMLALALAQIEAGQKTLGGEIVSILGAASEPLTVRDIYARLTHAPDRETLSREIFALAQAGTIKNVGDVAAPTGTPRKTVASYALPTAIDQREENTVDSKSLHNDILETVRANPKGISRADLLVAFKNPSAVDNALTLLCKEEKIHRPSRGFIVYGPAPKEEPLPSQATAKPQPEVGKNTGSVTSAPTSTEGHAVIEKAPAAEASASAPECDVADDAPEIDFAIHADGRLSIIDGDDTLILPPSATRRLGHFLGCLEMRAWPPRLDPAPLFDESSL